MKSVRKKLDEAAPLFEKGGKFEKLWPVFELQDTFLFTGDNVTRTASHVRDATDMKRLMVTVVVALLPCMFFACWNTGYEAMLAIAKGALPLDSWRTDLWEFLGFSYNFKSDFLCILFGALYWIPIYLTVMIAGGIAELLFAVF